MTAELVFRDLKDAFPDPNGLKALPVEIVGGLILKVLKDGWPRGQYGGMQLYGFVSVMREAYRRQELDRELLEQIGVAWQFLVSEYMLAIYPDTNASNGFVFITAKGRQAANQEDMARFIAAKKLPIENLHPSLRDSIYPNFLHGDYDTAVFQAFKEVEIKVREAGHYTATDYGVDLMNRAFNEQSGPLSDANLPEAEKKAMRALFAGAIGLFKNPQSHREVGLESPEATIELIQLASALLRLVDRNAT